MNKKSTKAKMPAVLRLCFVLVTLARAAAGFPPPGFAGEPQNVTDLALAYEREQASGIGCSSRDEPRPHGVGRGGRPDGGRHERIRRGVPGGAHGDEFRRGRDFPRHAAHGRRERRHRLLQRGRLPVRHAAAAARRGLHPGLDRGAARRAGRADERRLPIRAGLHAPAAAAVACRHGMAFCRRGQPRRLCGGAAEFWNPPGGADGRDERAAVHGHRVDSNAVQIALAWPDGHPLPGNRLDISARRASTRRTRRAAPRGTRWRRSRSSRPGAPHPTRFP